MITSRERGPGGRRGGSPSLPSGRWLVALPVWGSRCVDVLIRSTLPALLAALSEAAIQWELLFYTDTESRIRAVLPDNISMQFLPVPGPDASFMSMSNCHRHAMEAAGPSDRVLLLTADMVVSREVVATCERSILSGKQIVCCVAMRACELPMVPVGATGHELLVWAWENRHPMTRECTWPEGRSYDVWRMYFQNGEEVSARVFLPHPLAVLPSGQGRQLRFSPTIDVNLTGNFSQAFTHFITSPEEGAVIELSPMDKDFLMTTTMRERMINTQHSCPPFTRCTNSRHRMFFGKRMVIRGTGGDCGDETVVRRVLG